MLDSLSGSELPTSNTPNVTVHLLIMDHHEGVGLWHEILNKSRFKGKIENFERLSWNDWWQPVSR